VPISLREGWEQLWQNLDVQPSQAVFETLIKAYSATDRFYHNLNHIEDCLLLFDQTKSLAARPEEVELAIWFHDAVYDTKRSDNELKSAEWAEAAVQQAGLSTVIAERVSFLILATRHDQELRDRDAQFIVDVDLSILGRDAAVFWKYEESIRKEYAWVPAHLFRQRRIKILNGFLERQHIYYHLKFREMFEENAWSNLTQAIARLSEGIAA
jgi:predicted metal-dependent HD superfamily phosphohydrolase